MQQPLQSVVSELLPGLILRLGNPVAIEHHGGPRRKRPRLDQILRLTDDSDRKAMRLESLQAAADENVARVVAGVHERDRLRVTVNRRQDDRDELVLRRPAMDVRIQLRGDIAQFAAFGEEQLYRRVKRGNE